MSRNPVYRFLLVTALALPLWFLLWYLFAPPLLVPVTYLTDTILTTLWPNLIENVEQHGHLLEVITTISPRLERPVPWAQIPVFSFSLNPLIYGYGLPLLLAMAAAVPGAYQKPGRLLAALLVLLPVQALAVSGMAGYALLLQVPPQHTQVVVDTFGGREGVVLVYKITTLVLPNVVPVILWSMVYSGYLRFLAQQPIVQPEQTKERR